MFMLFMCMERTLRILRCYLISVDNGVFVIYTFVYIYMYIVFHKQVEEM